MSARIFLLHLLVCLGWMSCADVLVNFRNNVLSPPQLVYTRSLSTFEEVPLVNEGVGGFIQYTAQLYWGLPGTSENALQPVGGFVNFRSVPVTDPLAGTWSGANRRIPGVAPDTTLLLQVRVFWNSRPWGRSAPFLYRDVLNSPPQTTDTFMVNFRGCGAFEEPPPYSFATHENATLKISLPCSHIGWGSSGCGMTVSQRPDWMWWITPSAGDVSGSLAEITYVPARNLYGPDTFLYPFVNGCCAGVVYGTVTVDVLPNPARDQPLLLSRGSKTSGPVLLGLDQQHYRLEVSNDLASWEAAGEVTGSFSEVDLSHLVQVDQTSQFVRAIKVP